MRPIIKALQVKSRVIGALVYRSLLSEHGTTRLGYIAAIFKALGKVIMLSTIFMLISRNVPVGDNLIIFLASGILPFSMCIDLVNKIMTMNKSGRMLMTHPLITPLDIAISILILQSAITLIASIILLLGAGLLGLWDYKIASLLGILLTSITAILLGFGVGLMNVSIVVRVPSYEKIWQLLSMPLFILSGIFYVSDMLPREALDVLKYNPLMHITESMRDSFYRGWNSSFVNQQYLLFFTTVTIFLGLFLEKTTQKRVRE